MFTGEVKKRLAEVLTEMVERHRVARAAVTDDVSLFKDSNESMLLGDSFAVLVGRNSNQM